MKLKATIGFASNKITCAPGEIIDAKITDKEIKSLIDCGYLEKIEKEKEIESIRD